MPIATLPRRAYLSAINLIFPLRCLVCGEDISQYETMPLCPEHRRKITLIDRPYCDRCGKKLFSIDSMEQLCLNCRETNWHFDRCFSATIYGDVMQHLVPQYKYGMRSYLSRPFARLMASFIRQQVDYSELDLAVPVPLHWRRYIYRGFNQAYELIRHFAREFGLTVSRGNLRRIVNTTPQVRLSPEERKENIIDAFKAVRPERFQREEDTPCG